MPIVSLLRLDAVTWAVADRPRPTVAMLEQPDPRHGRWAGLVG